MSNPISRFIGQKAWEMSHPKQVKKEIEMTKGTTPAGQDRDMQREDMSKRRAAIERELEKEEYK